MSTDDSISEDVSSSGPLSHCHVSADLDAGKESEASLLSSEGTSASGPAHRHTTASQKTVEGRSVDITPACNTIRSLCLSTEEAFEQEKNLPFINPSSLETLRALVQEIQSSGETDPEIWKDCEGRWLHLFQLVEKQYQEQILAQQEQYQCQIQLIQDEIKALVQLQNRQAAVQPHADFPQTAATKTSPKEDYLFPLLTSSQRAALKIPDGVPAAPVQTPLSSPSPPPLPVSEAAEERRAATGLSSGYGTLSAWGSGLEPAGSPGDEEEDEEEEEEGRERGRWGTDFQEDAEPDAGRQREFTSEKNLEGRELNNLSVYQQKTSSSQHFTSWAQRHKLRPRKGKAGPVSPPIPENQPDESRSPKPFILETQPDLQDQQQQRVAGPPSSSPFLLRRSDSLTSEASGLTYWRLNEFDLYRPLPDSLDSGAFLLLQDASISPTPQEPRLSLREIYHSKQRSDCRRSDWEGSAPSSPSSPQAMVLDPSSNARQSDRTSGFTSPSHFGSPSFAAQPLLLLSPRVGTPVTPDSAAAEGGAPSPSDTSCTSDASSPSPLAAPSPSNLHTSSSCWGAVAAASTSCHGNREEDEGSRTHTSTLKPRPLTGSPQAARSSSLEDPIVLSLLRQNLREKHSRHVADLKAYYESEIQSLREKLQLRHLPQDLEKSNQALAERCKHLEKALCEATSRVQDLEATNRSLERKLAEWPERYAVAGAAVKSLQQRLDESKRSGREKDALAARLKARARQLEEAAQKAEREADEKEARREREYKMLQELLGEYDALMKEHEGVKNNLLSTENKLVDASDQISQLKRVVSKLESQVKQLEHENQARSRYASHSNTQPSGAGLFHHPDLLLSPTKCKVEPDVTHRRSSPCPPPEQHATGRKSPFPQASQSHKRASYPSNGQSSRAGSSGGSSSAGGSWRCASPPECEQLPPQIRQQEQSQRREASSTSSSSSVLTPMMRALIQLEETRATEARAPWIGLPRTTVGFMERQHKEVIRETVGLLQVDHGAAGKPEGGGRGGGGGAALLRAQRSLSPEGHRSSSLPPPGQRNLPPTTPTTPTKRETLLTPLSAKSSPKRCPTENYSTAFGHMMPREEHFLSRAEGHVDRRRHSFHSSSPSRRLRFPPADGEQDPPRPEKPSRGSSQLGWEDPAASGGRSCAPDLLDSCEDPTPPPERLPSLGEAEKLFDELTQEKLQIEAALSRMPAGGGRVSLQARLDEVALEDRLERVNRELGSLRMTLKRFHVLRSSANTQ